MRTQVAIIGAGPAGLVLSHLLALQGIDSGVLEQGTVDLLNASGVGARLQREGLVHHGIELRLEGQSHRIPLTELTGGRSITVYGQQEVVKDLIAARLEAGGQVLFEAEALAVEEPESAGPKVRYRLDGQTDTLESDFVAGCDGFWGVSRQAFPAGLLKVYDREYPFAWLGILAATAPASDELIYASHNNGFALLSTRSPEVSRLYLQVRPDEPLDDWPNSRIWQELQTRFATDAA